MQVLDIISMALGAIISLYGIYFYFRSMYIMSKINFSWVIASFFVPVIPSVIFFFIHKNNITENNKNEFYVAFSVFAILLIFLIFAVR